MKCWTQHSFSSSSFMLRWTNSQQRNFFNPIYHRTLSYLRGAREGRSEVTLVIGLLDLHKLSRTSRFSRKQQLDRKVCDDTGPRPQMPQIPPPAVRKKLENCIFSPAGLPVCLFSSDFGLLHVAFENIDEWTDDWSLGGNNFTWSIRESLLEGWDGMFSRTFFCFVSLPAFNELEAGLQRDARQFSSFTLTLTHF